MAAVLCLSDKSVYPNFVFFLFCFLTEILCDRLGSFSIDQHSDVINLPNQTVSGPGIVNAACVTFFPLTDFLYLFLHHYAVYSKVWHAFDVGATHSGDCYWPDSEHQSAMTADLSLDATCSLQSPNVGTQCH